MRGIFGVKMTIKKNHASRSYQGPNRRSARLHSNVIHINQTAGPDSLLAYLASAITKCKGHVCTVQ